MEINKMTELIIAEKPNAAKKIAEALADGKVTKKNSNGVPYYNIRHDGNNIIVACAVGHLYTVAPIKKSYSYPQFDTKWTETANVDKNASFSRKYVKTLKELAKQADTFTVATDFDIEGEVIGFNVIKHICKQKDANRMKFSTLTKGDLVDAYQGKQKTIDWGQANAGLTRHELDWYYGINLSSALMSAIKAAGSFKVLSSGRVQGPALKLLCDKELEIKAFVPEPFWQIQLLGEINRGKIEAWHALDKIFDEKKADEIMQKTKTPHAFVRKREVTQFNQQPPFPFDLTSFQIECYRVHKISPKETLSVAQELYTAGYISYPRTSSQKLPAKLGYEKLISALAANPKYAKHAEFLLSKKTLKPNEGKKEDDAHPAIYPTGIVPEDIPERSLKVYDLIVRRFLATFGDIAVRETVKAIIDVNKEDFICKGTTTKVKGWHELYGPYATFDEVVLPLFDEKDPVIVQSISKLDKETQPPKRYTQASIIKELDKRNLGTKATRAAIIDSLYNRGYVNNKSMEVTDLGLKTCEILNKYSPEILDEELTRKFEEELEKIRKKSMTPEQVLKEAQDVLTKLLADFKTKEKKIGEELKQAQYDSKDAAATVGPCPNCGKGTLKVRRGKFGNFIGCDAYPDCKTIISLPKNVQYQLTKKVGDDGWPVIKVKSGKIWKDVSVNAKEDGDGNGNTNEVPPASEKKYPEEGMTCPNCKKGQMVLRKSFYGEFLGCNNYPKCKTMMKITDGKVEVDKPISK
ncbi:DNA topoisomerase I [Candidatus Woesearchaeota archaeon]|nr:DNA topoisomerase I [Candidatus Woesearchaeota archaeon]